MLIRFSSFRGNRGYAGVLGMFGLKVDTDGAREDMPFVGDVGRNGGANFLGLGEGEPTTERRTLWSYNAS